jgi:hypothetical protein
VVQQRAGVHLKGGVGEAGDAYEQSADAIAESPNRRIAESPNSRWAHGCALQSVGSGCAGAPDLRGNLAPRLTQDHSPAQHPCARSQALGGHGGFHRGDPLA